MKSRRQPRYRTRRAPLRSQKGRPTRRTKATSRRRKLVPIIPDTPKGGSSPSYFELLQEAVLTLKEERRGVTLPEIRRQMLKKYKGRFDKASNKLFTTALKRLAEQGEVIYKQGYKYRFNVPKVSKHKPKSSASETNVTSASTYSGVSATSGSNTDTTAGRSMDPHTSTSFASDSGTRSTRSTRSTKSSKSTKKTNSTKSTKRMPAQDEPQAQEKAPQDAESPEKVDEEKSSARDLSSSVAASASRGSSRRRH